MAEARPPSRVVLVFAALLTQLVGAACFVLGLASFPVMHDLHRPLHVLVGWVAAAVGALLFGGLSYRARPIPLALAAVIDAGFGYALPRKDSALGALAQLLPEGDVDLADTVVTAVAIGMFVVAGLCLLAIPFAVRYRRWEATDEGIRVSRQMMAVTPADTLKGVGRAGAKPMTTLVIRTSALDRRSRPWVITLVAATLVGTGLAVMLKIDFGHHGKHTQAADVGSGSGGAPRAGSSAPIKPGAATQQGGASRDAGVAAADATADAPVAPPPAPPPDSPQHLVEALHDAIARGDAAALGALLAPDVFAVGPDADELAEGRDAALAVLARELPPAGMVSVVDTAHTTIGQDGKLAWIAEEIAVTPAGGAARRFVTSTLATPAAGGRWAIAALTWAVAVPNDTAFRLARAGQLPLPGAIADRTNSAPELAEAARAAFGSRESFAGARSRRADAFNYGSAPGERMVGGEGIRRAFAHMGAQLTVHDGVTVVPLGDRAGWSAANVDFTAPDKGGATVTQTFRVLAGWVREDGTWRIVYSQFSNARPR